MRERKRSGTDEARLVAHGPHRPSHLSDGQWTEVANIVGPRLVLILLSDPGHQISAAAAQQILAQIGS